MADRWQQDIPINTKLAQQLITQYCNITITTIKELGDGFNNSTYLINSSHVFRFPRRKRGIEYMKNEIALLPLIADKIPFACSAPEFICNETPEYPYPFTGYKLVIGTQLSEQNMRPINDTQFATTLAHWLKKLHAIPVNPDHHTLLHGDQSWQLSTSERKNACIWSIERYTGIYEKAGFNPQHLISLFDHLQNNNDSNTHTVYCHGDLQSSHILTNAIHQPTGLIDWGDICINNPGLDLAVGIMIFEHNAFSTFLKEYGTIDATTWQNMLLRALYHPIRTLPYCYATEKKQFAAWITWALNNVIYLIESS